MDALAPMRAHGPLKNLRMSETAYEAIEGAIVRCELPPGTPLVDRQLSEALGVSRTPIRDAMQSLEAAGLVVRVRGRYSVAGFDLDDVRELYQVRRLLEPLGLEHLAETWDEEVVDELAGFFDAAPAPGPPGPYEEYLARDHAFHKRIVALAGNSRLTRFYAVNEKQINRIRHYLAPGYEGRMTEVVDEHKDVCGAIGRKDLAAARAALIGHLEAGEATMIKFLAQQQERTGNDGND
ncbi:DNA-binding GntR family transcriptional regulator [Spinactinospora alkalitolerans]|uniref:DNA-binding GntR family transcriptional regulator n=1 Tax=Spinactinospora alkalitolerans TaxID=687207 RepID=A0A852U1V2_9ACTN|nr:GntR family transcriptional regulator [Spinactinospora alkalitolerans]NYE50846.1 DNA-binding GntR family transcriptional regulator [Spinactinospora alkalitolerans]